MFMEQHSAPATETNPAAQAFGELRAELSLLRRAVERLTDERVAQPDYAPTLELIDKRFEQVVVWARKVSEKPALGLTPEIIAGRIAAAAVDARAEDRAMLQTAATRMEAAGSRIDGLIDRGRAADEQRRELIHNRIAFAVAGMLLWAILPGAVARSLPVSWAVPERIAARMLGTDMWQAGQQMMKKGEETRDAEQSEIK